MKISQKHTCNGCRAYEEYFDGRLHHAGCWLGYSQVENRIPPGALLGAYPTEPCPKPRTHKDMWNCARKKQKDNHEDPERR
jgi:hypothetical protein